MVGTAQHVTDLFFQLKKNESFVWREYKALLNEADKKTLWPEMFPYERLVEIRDKEIGERAFNKEFQCSPVYSEDAFFKREDLQAVINPALENKPFLPEHLKGSTVVAGLDIGKHVHPSHLAVFAVVQGRYVQFYGKFFDNVEYIEQVRQINEIIAGTGIDKLYYDNTRGEFEGFVEQGIIDKRVWQPVTFKTTEMYAMAAQFEKIVKDRQVELLNDERQMRSILGMSNDLSAVETVDGHADAFWSVAMSVRQYGRTVSWKIY